MVDLGALISPTFAAAFALSGLSLAFILDFVLGLLVVAQDT